MSPNPRDTTDHESTVGGFPADEPAGLRYADLWVVLLLTFAISWGGPALLFVMSRLGAGHPLELGMYSPMYYAAVWAPAIASLAVVWWRLGTAGLRAFVRRVAIWRVGIGWYAFVLLGLPAIHLLAAVVATTAGEPALLPFGVWTLWLSETLRRGTTGPLEELAWRGVALPLLQRRMSGAQAAVLLGCVWGLWHLPAFVVGTIEQGMVAELPLIALYLMQSAAISIIATVMFNATRGSLLLAMLLQWMSSIPYPWAGPTDAFAARALLLAVVAVVFVAVFRTRYLGRTSLVTDVIGPAR